MIPRLIILTGASGSGKTTIGRALGAQAHGAYEVFLGDDVGVPSSEVMRSYGEGHQPGGAWQRAMTLGWMARTAEQMQAGRTVLLEGQMRLAFIYEALATERIVGARVILVDCGDAERTRRLTHERAQPHLADNSMMGWARHFREEALQYGCEVLDTGAQSVESSVKQIHAYLVD